MLPKAQIYIDGELIGEGELKEFVVKQKPLKNIPDKTEQIVFEFELESNQEQLNTLRNLITRIIFRHKTKRIFRGMIGKT